MCPLLGSHGPRAAITAYVLSPIRAVSTPAGALSMSNRPPPPSGCPSRMPDTNLGLSGCVMSKIRNDPLPSEFEWPGVDSAVTIAYVRDATTNVSMPRGPCSRSSSCE